MDRESVNESVLTSWLRLTHTISNERIVSDMPYNEAVICNILYRHEKSGETPLTATDLCKKTKMLKSQMNRTLTQMEEKNMIHRVRSQQDKRQVYVTLNSQAINLYIQQHTKVLSLIDKMVGHFGYEEIEKIRQLFEEISDIAEEVIG